MTMTRRLVVPLLFLIMLLLSGCGGSGGGGRSTTNPSPTARAAFRVGIDWPDRTRAIVGVASANSATLEATSRQEVSRITVNRPAGTAASSQQYTATTPLPVGNILLRIRFYSEADGRGRLVGRADVVAGLADDGTLTQTDGHTLPQVVLATTVQSVEVGVGQTLIVGQSQELAATAHDSTGAIVAVDPGAYSFRVQSGQEFLNVTPAGSATALAVGTAMVVATVDGISSDPTAVQVEAPPSAAFKIDVTWPARTRDVQGLNSALSVRLDLDKNGHTVSTTADRPAGLQAQVQSVLAPEATELGAATLHVRFFSETAAGGTEVGSVDVPVALQQDGSLTQPNGEPLGDVIVDGVIKSVFVNSESVHVGSSVELMAFAFTANFDFVPVTPGSFQFALTSGQDKVALTADGQATGVAPGTAKLRVTVDGITSDEGTLTILGNDPTSIRTVDLATTDLVYDGTRSLLWATTMSSGSPANSLVSIDAASGSVNSAATFDSEPRRLAVTDDGQFVYVALANGKIHRINAQSHDDELTFNLSEWAVLSPAEIEAVPGQPHAVLATGVAGDESNPAIATVYDDGVPRPQIISIGHFISFGDDNVSVYGFQRFQSGSSFIRRAVLGPQGLTLDGETTDAEGFGNRIHYGGGRIWEDSGVVRDAQTFGRVGQLDFVTVDHVGMPVIPSNRMAFIEWDPKRIRLYDTTTYQSVFATEPMELSGGCEDLVSAGSGRMAFRTFGAADLKVVIVSNLPL